ncbi:MAG: hypothetical protein M0C28_30345 [Candidatus Moduliflexus flocculans]|nr:hypothetical protein [Candidatus Moduliflexus flocculans]
MTKTPGVDVNTGSLGPGRFHSRRHWLWRPSTRKTDYQVFAVSATGRSRRA